MPVKFNKLSSMGRRFTIYSVFLDIRKSIFLYRKFSIFLYQKATFNSLFHIFYIKKLIYDMFFFYQKYFLISKNEFLVSKKSNFEMDFFLISKVFLDVKKRILGIKKSNS